MIFETIVVGPLGVNCILLGSEKGGEGVVVDPGDETERIVAKIREHQLEIVAIINTHGHFDHVGGNHPLKQVINAPLYIHPGDAPLLKRVASTAAIYGLPGVDSPAADRELADGDSICFGRHCIKVIHTPGHTPGCCSLYLDDQSLLLSGDTLFAEGVGRTDLPGGSHQQLVGSIREKLFILPDDVRVVPGHGPSTTIGHEKRHNIYLR